MAFSLNNAVRKKLKDIIKDKNVNMYRLARCLGMEDRTVRRKLASSKMVDLETIAWIAEGIGEFSGTDITIYSILEEIKNEREAKRSARIEHSKCSSEHSKRTSIKEKFEWEGASNDKQ